MSRGLFPYNLQKNFFLSYSLNFIQSTNVQIFFIALKTLIKSEEFMNNLGKKLVIMAQDGNYHGLIYKKDLVLLMSKDISTLENKQRKTYLINFPDGLKGIIGMDNSDSWIIDTPMVLLLLLWIFIDNCKTSVQRIYAKLALVDLLLIQSPMINKFMPYFLAYIQDKLLFMPNDFDQIYIHHLSTLAFKNPDNQQIINFYECEKNNFTSSKQIEGIEEIELTQINHHYFTPTKIIQLIQFLKNYKSVNDFPVWNFLHIWKTFSSLTYEKYSDDDNAYMKNDYYADVYNPLYTPLLYTFTIYCGDEEDSNCLIKIFDFNNNLSIGNIVKLKKSKNIYFGYYTVNPNERKRIVWQFGQNDKLKTRIYKITPNDQFTKDKLIADIKSFAVDWDDSNTDELLLECRNINFECEDFMPIILETLNMSNLIRKFGTQAVQCKVYCIYLLNAYYQLVSQKLETDLTKEEAEIKRLIRKNSRFLPYQTRLNQFSIQASILDINIFIQRLANNGGLPLSITLNADLAFNFMNGESDNICDSMIYQLSEAIKKHSAKRFENIIWFISFKGSDAFDSTGPTNQTITMAINSFLYLKTGLCIISPNFTESTPNSVTVDPNDMGTTLVIPYPTKNDINTDNMLFTFGIALGSMIRNGLTQDIPFPLFIWNFLAGKPITKEDVYENDTRLRDQIVSMREGKINDQYWTYRDWNNVIKPIFGFPEDKVVPLKSIDIYEALVVDLRIKSLAKCLSIIQYGLFINQNISRTSLLSGGLILFLCQGKKEIDIAEIIKRLSFEGGNEQLKNNLISILNEYDQTMIKKFLLFVTAKQRPPNFFVVPDYYITVSFDDNLKVTGLPTANTCFNKIKIPIYPTLNIMKNMLNRAILECEGIDNE